MKVDLNSESRLSPLASLRPDDTNVREKISAKDPAFIALVESMKRDGVLEPLVVRPDGLIVCGHRRYAAAKAAGLDEVPVHVRDIADEDLRAVRLVENMHRKDLSPIEESDAFAAMKKVDQRSEEEIAERAGISLATVRRRLQLQNLPAAVKKALRAEQISTTVATAIANIPLRESQLGALSYATTPGWDNEMPTDRDVINEIQRSYMTELEGVSFDITDKTLSKKNGACTECPFNTANDDVLFAEMKKDGKGLCTQPNCFTAKKEENTKRVLAKVKERGLEVIDETHPEKGSKVPGWFSYGGNLAHGAPWVLTTTIPGGQPNKAKKQLKTLLPQDQIEVVALVSPQSGEVLEVYPKSPATKLLRQTHAWAEKVAQKQGTTAQGLNMGGNSYGEPSPKDKAAKMKARYLKKGQANALGKITSSVAAMGEISKIGAKAVDVLVIELAAAHNWGPEALKHVVALFEISNEDKEWDGTIVRRHLRTSPNAKNVAIALVVFEEYFRQSYGISKDEPNAAHVLLDAIGVDHKEIVELSKADAEIEYEEAKKKKAAADKRKAAKEKAKSAPKSKTTTKKKASAKSKTTKKPVNKRVKPGQGTTTVKGKK